jgi:hypothetical protein
MTPWRLQCDAYLEQFRTEIMKTAAPRDIDHFQYERAANVAFVYLDAECEVNQEHSSLLTSESRQIGFI